jgi:hypothetical protein
MLNAKERDAESWISLISTANLGFKLNSIDMPPDAKLAVIEIIWEGESYTEI